MLSFKEFLAEGTFSLADAEKTKYVEAIIQRMRDNVPVKLGSGEEVYLQYDPTLSSLAIEGDVKKIRAYVKDNQFIEKDTGRKILFSKIDKLPFSGAVGTKKTANKGDVAEGIMGAAIAAKFLNPTKQIKDFDVKSILSQMSAKTTTRYEWVHKSPTSGTDKIVLSIDLAPNNLEALFDKSFWNELSPEFNGAIKFANSRSVGSHAKQLDMNNTDDIVIISAEGTLDQKGTKVDLSVKIGLNGNPPQPTDLNLSIKSGTTKNLEQAGVSYDRVANTFRKFGVNISRFSSSFKKDLTWYDQVFTNVVEQLNRQFRNETTAINIIEKLGAGIKETATRNDPNVLQVKIDKGDFKVLQYKDIDEKLKGHKFFAYFRADEIKDRTSGGMINSRPELRIVEKTTGKDVLTFRIEVRRGDVIYKMHIEAGQFLTDLAKLH